jgi:WD40 repeat protein
MLACSRHPEQQDRRPLVYHFMDNMKTVLRLALVLASLIAVATAQNTHSWEQSKLEEFEKGTAKGVSIRSDGALELAPAFRQIATTSSAYIWSAASDERGNLYAATGSPAKVYRITPKGEVSVIFAASELQVQALAVDRSGAIYAATSPDGRVYRIVHSPGGSGVQAGGAESSAAPIAAEKQTPPAEQVDPNYVSSVYFDPKSKYIWALAIDNEGRLYVATGDHGEIFRVEKGGTGSVFFKSDDASILSIALDRDGNLIAGSDGSGLIYRINSAGQGFVLYGAPKKEITALALDSQGNIYAAGTGEKRPSAPPPHPAATGPTAPAPAAVTTPSAPPPGAHPATPAAATPPHAAVPMPVPPVSATGSEIYRIAPDGSPKTIWRSRDDLVYALTFDHSGRLIAGTGNRGKIYAIEGNGEFADLLKASANQVTGFAAAPNGGIYTACSNLGKVFLMEDSSQREGTFESDAFDARIFSRWGRVEMRGQGLIELYARSGNVDNPDRNWSPWSKIDLKGGAETQVPPARYAQWRAVLHSGPTPPRIYSLRIYYLPKNVAPEVDEVTVQMARPASVPHPEGGPAAVASAPPSGKNHIIVRWAAHDENGDQLRFSIYYRADGDRRWLLLKDDLSERSYGFDPSLIPDGGYTFRVVASDAPSHPPNEALTGWKDSAHVEVDTTPPAIANLHAALEGDRLHVSFSATDSFSAIQRAEYSIDATDWQFVAPVGEISDSRTENYDFSVPVSTQPEPFGESSPTGSPARRRGHRSAAAAGAAPQTGSPPNAAGAEEHIITVRVYDRADNVVTAKTVVRVGQ